MTRALRALGAGTLIVTTACSVGTRQVQVGPDGGVEVEGVQVPASFGAYTVHGVEEHDYEPAGSSVRYMPDDSVRATMPTLDLFVYPLDGLRLDAHAENERRILMSIRPRGVQDVQMGAMTRMPPPRGIHPIHVQPMRIILNGADLRSIMYISRVRERNLKIRVSYPTSWGFDMDDVMHDQARLLIGDIVGRSER